MDNWERIIRKEEEELGDEEIEEQTKKLKNVRAGGSDGLSNEVWVYNSKETRRKFREVVKRVWKGEGFPEEWKEGLITLIFKKGDKRRIENYRGITLLNSAYEV